MVRRLAGFPPQAEADPERRLALVEIDTALDGADGGQDQADGVGPHARCCGDPGEGPEPAALLSSGGH